MSPERRIQYRETLDDAGSAVDEAKSVYDSLYDLEGAPLPAEPLPSDPE